MTTLIEDVVAAPAPGGATVTIPAGLPDPTLTGRDILHLAADLIEKYGHARWNYEDDEGRLCALGAISMAAFGDPNLPSYSSSEGRDAWAEGGPHKDAVNLLVEHLRKGDPMLVWVPEWNDRLGLFHKRRAIRAIRGAACA